MKRLLGHQALIIIVAACSYFIGLGSTSLWDEDEAFFAAAAAEMHRHNDWIVPTYNEELFAHKPPFMYWMMRLGFLMFGVNELGARFFSGVFGIATAIICYHIGRRLFDASTGLWAGLALATGLMWSVVSRASTADAYLGCFIAAALLVYVRAVFPQTVAASQDSPATRELALQRWIPQRWSTLAGIYALMALAVLVKGPIGVLLPGATIGLFVLCQVPVTGPVPAGIAALAWSRLRTMLTAFPAAFWRLRPFTAIGLVLAIAGPWFVAVAIRTDGEFLREFFGVHNFGRFLKPMENHRGPLFYYLPVIAIGFFPWSIFAMPTFLHAARDPQARDRNVFLLCWAGWMIGFFSIASTKLPNYVLPAYPALALLTGSYLSAWIAGRESRHATWPRIAFSCLAIVGLLLMVGLAIVPRLSADGQPLLAKLGVNAVLSPALGRLVWIGIVPLAGGLAALLLARQNRRTMAMGAIAVASTLFTASVLIGAAGTLNPYQTSAPLAAALQKAQKSTAGMEGAVGSFRHSPPSLIYYAQQRVERISTPTEAADFLNGQRPGYLVTTDVGLKQLQETSSRPIRIIDRRPRFPRKGEILLISAESTETSQVQQASSDSPVVR